MVAPISYHWLYSKLLRLIKSCYVSLFLRLFSSFSMNLLSRSSASSLRPPAKMGSGGGSMIEMVLALFVLAEIWVLCVDTMFRFTLLSLLLLLFWLLLMLAEIKKLRIANWTWGRDWIFLHLLLSFRFLPDGLSAAQFCEGQRLDRSLAAKWVWLLITSNCCLSHTVTV